MNKRKFKNLFSLLFVMALKRRHSSLDSKNEKQKKNGYEKKPETRFKRMLASLGDEQKEKKLNYARDPKVQERRQFLNYKRNIKIRILCQKLRRGELYDEDGNPYDCIGGVICLPHDKIYFNIDKKGNLGSESYDDDLKLYETVPFKEVEDPSEARYKELCLGFINGDPEVMKLVSNKKVLTTIQNPLIEQLDTLKKKVQNKLDGIYNDGDSDED